MIKEDKEPIIQFTNVEKKYRDVTALRGVTFTINKGDIFGYIGPNGAGKTTTLKILVGLIRDYSGNVMIDGQLLQDYPNPGNLIGYLPQDVGFQEWRTVDQALLTLGLLSGLKREQLANRIPEVLELVGLADSRKRKIKHLSGGMQQKLKLAQALLHNPPILVLDEPMSGLDPTSRWQMKNIIRKLAERDITIIFSSHILGDVEDIANNIGIISNGIIVKIGHPQTLQKELVGGEGVQLFGLSLHENIPLIQKLSIVQKVESSIETPDRLVVLFNSNVDTDSALAELMKFLGSNKIVIYNFNYLKPSLEQVYLKYVMGGIEA